MQAKAARLAFGRGQPSASITFGSRRRRFSLPELVNGAILPSKPPGIRRMSD
jgi:hypothetical protein